MGRAKEAAERDYERGWSHADGFVCYRCVDDYALRRIIRSDQRRTSGCSCCGKKIAVDLDLLLESFMTGLQREYSDFDRRGVYFADDESGPDGFEWWQNRWDTTRELLEDVFGEVLIGNGLIDRMCAAIGNDRRWIEAHEPQLPEDVALFDSWNSFSNAVKHKTRYVFWILEEEEWRQDQVPANTLPEVLGQIMAALNLIRTMPSGFKIWRVRTHQRHPGGCTASSLGTAPLEHAKVANRMSPGGIPMFYGALDNETARAEVTRRRNYEWTSEGCFETSTTLKVFDFTLLPSEPSIFDLDLGEYRREIVFLHEFVNDLKKAVDPDDEVIEYVPTQAMTEYLLQIFGKAQEIRGMFYPSSINGRKCAVLDVKNDSCVTQESGWTRQDAEGQLRLGLIPLSTNILARDAEMGRAHVLWQRVKMIGHAVPHPVPWTHLCGSCSRPDFSNVVGLPRLARA
jgi:hypothetical protein